MGRNKESTPTDAFAENKSFDLSEYENGRITVGQQLSIQQPKPEEYLAISKWDVGRIIKRCKELKNQSIIVSDIILTIGSLSSGLFLSWLFGGVDASSPMGKPVFYISTPVIGSCAILSAYFLKRGEHVNSKKLAEDIEEILYHISQEKEVDK